VNSVRGIAAFYGATGIDRVSVLWTDVRTVPQQLHDQLLPVSDADVFEAISAATDTPSAVIRIVDVNNA
jgi:hypothetical protein